MVDLSIVFCKRLPGRVWNSAAAGRVPMVQVFSGGKHIRSANDLVQATDLQEMSLGGTKDETTRMITMVDLFRSN
jgi:hypothetical protein